MSNFLKLTQWAGYRVEGANTVHGKSIYVNLLLITDISISRGSVINSAADYKKSVEDRDWEEYTELNLVGGHGEATNTRAVQESPEQIIQMIEEEMG